MQRPAKEKEPLTVAAIRNAHVKQLQWAVQFIRQDLGELRAGEWLSLKEALCDFTLGKLPEEFGAIAKYEEERFVQEISQKMIQDIQSSMIPVFNQLAERPLHPEQYSGDTACDFGVKEAVLGFGCSSWKSPFVWDFHQFGSSDKVGTAQIALAEHLVGSMLTREQFLRCPECKSIFISNRKPRPDRQLHCSIKCSRGAASRRYREKLSEQKRAAERERSHGVYKKRVNKARGRLTKVHRRPRKPK